MFCRTKKRGGNTEEVLRKRSIPSKLPSSDMLDIISNSSNIVYSKIDYARFTNVSIISSCRSDLNKLKTLRNTSSSVCYLINFSYL